MGKMTWGPGGGEGGEGEGAQIRRQEWLELGPQQKTTSFLPSEWKTKTPPKKQKQHKKGS